MQSQALPPINPPSLLTVEILIAVNNLPALLAPSGIAAYLSSASRHAITWPVHWLAQRQLQQKTAQEQTAQGRDPEQ